MADTSSPIYIDNRAGSKELVKYAPLNVMMGRGEVQLTTLASADIMFAGNGPTGDVLVGVEAKTVTDLLSSANTGRLQATQIPAMIETYSAGHLWLLYYGDYKVDDDGHLHTRSSKGGWRKAVIGSRGVPFSYLESLLTSLAMMGIHVRYVPTIVEAAYWIAAVNKWYSKPWDKHKGMRTFDTSRDITMMPGADDATLLRARVAAQLPGVGFERALAAGRHFTSVVSMVVADDREWAQVEGIGKVVAKAVVRAIHSDSGGK